jgi:DNA-binding transcriptional LysR family regulator
MTLDQLRVFVAVAERQHVTRAAEALNLAQSAASAAIAALEARYGAKLFTRTGRGIALTEAGQQFLPAARAVLGRVEAAELLLSELAGLKRGTLAIQASQTIASYWLPRHLMEFRQAHPGITIRLSIANSAQVMEAVHAGAAELGFIEDALADPALAVEQVARDQMIIVTAPGHPWCQAAAISPQDLADSPWVMREPGSGTRSTFESMLHVWGVPAASLRVAMELPSNEAVRAAVEAGMGATAISASVVAASLEAGLLARVPIDLPDRGFFVVHDARRGSSQSALALLRQLRR